MKNRSITQAHIAVCGLVLSCGCVVQAQYFQRLVGTPVDEAPRGITQMQNEDYVTTGFRMTNLGFLTTYVSRHRSDGSLVWAYDYLESSTSTGWSAVPTFNGDVIVAGQTDAVLPDLRLSLMRLNPAGLVSWVAAYDSTGLQTGEIFTGVRRNVAMETVFDIGVAVVTSEDRPNFPGYTRAQMLVVDLSGSPMFQKNYITSITVQPVGVTFNDLRLVEGPFGVEIVVTGTVEFGPFPGIGGPNTFEALYARFDLAGNPLAAFSYRFQPAAGGPTFDMYGDGIQTTPGGGVVIMGRTTFFDPDAADAAVLRLTPAGVPVWSRAISGIAPAAAAMSRSDVREIVTAGHTSQNVVETGSIGLLNVDEAGNHIFSRKFSEPSFGAVSLGRDQVWSGGSHPGWATVGDEDVPHTFGARDIDLVRTDRFGRVGCEEIRVPANVQAPFVLVRQLSLLQVEVDRWTFRQVSRVDPGFAENVICEGSCPCPGDANGDSVIDFDDINAVIGSWGAVYAPGSGPGDADCNGVVDFNDLNLVLANWGGTCP